MKNEKSQVRRILIAMIVDSSVLGRIASKWDEKGLFRDEWANLVGGWCVEFYEKYGRAPRKHIEGLFATWAEEHADKTLVRLLEKFLASLSGEYARLRKELNAEYMIDAAIDHFNQVRVELHIETLQANLDKGKIDKAYKAASMFGKLELNPQQMVAVLEDKSVLNAVYAENVKPVIEYRGALNNFFQDTFQRDGLVGFMGPEKRGKTFWLIDAAWRAMEQGHRVAFFEVGDLSRNQIMRRFMARAAKRPFKPKSIQVPTAIEHPEDDRLPEVEFEERMYNSRLSKKRAWMACKKVIKKSGKDLLRLGVWPNTMLNVIGLRSELRLLERMDWVPDVVVIDYADLLGLLPGYPNESQEQIDMTWKLMRSMSQQLHCCVITATQSNAASYYATTIDRSHFTRDKRKFGHVTAMIGISQTKDEKQLGIYRLNQLSLRESEYDEEKCIYTAGCLALANPAIRSTF